ncbi:MAG TPA: magnesium transporter CorA family protein [Candidatus Saccharimonadales bacterium]|nr:magnesium transporter CorA family protein [Candidatus Saccharimonadales bacterium]
MIKYYYRSLRRQNIQQINEYKRGTWVYVEAPSEKELGQLAEKFGLDLGHLQDAIDEDEMPRLEKEGDHAYIFMRFAYKNSDNEIVTAPLLFVFTDDGLVTVSLVRFPALDRFLAARVDFATTQRAKLVLQILHEMVEQYDTFISGTSKQIKFIRSRLRGHGISNKDFVDFVTIEDELNEFLGALQPTNATLRRLLLGRHMPLFEEDQDIVEDLLLANEQSIEACSSNIKSIVNIREAYTSISSNNLNQTMKVLTVATVIIALPNLFYGMYGMNVPLPLQHEPWAYWAVLGFTLAIVIVGLWLARRKRII